MNAKNLLNAVASLVPGHYVALVMHGDALAVSIVEHGSLPLGLVGLDEADEARDPSDLAAEIVANYHAGVASHHATLAAKEATS